MYATEANSPLAGIVHALVLVLVLLFLAPLAEHVPLAALAAVLFVVAWNMSEVRHFAGMLRRAPRADVAILLITFFLTVFADLVLAVNVGVILAMFQFLRRMAMSVEVQQLVGEELDAVLARREWQALPPGVMVYSVEGPMFFGAVDTFERALAQTHTDPKRLILHLRRVPFIDITGLQSLEEALRDLKRRGVDVMLSGANPRVRHKLERAGLLDLVGVAGYHDDLDSALTQANWGANLDGPAQTQAYHHHRARPELQRHRRGTDHIAQENQHGRDKQRDLLNALPSAMPTLRSRRFFRAAAECRRHFRRATDERDDDEADEGRGHAECLRRDLHRSDEDLADERNEHGHAGERGQRQADRPQRLVLHAGFGARKQVTMGLERKEHAQRVGHDQKTGEAEAQLQP